MARRDDATDARDATDAKDAMVAGGAAGARFVLASASPRRRELLASAGLTFDVIPADADETLPDAPPERAAVTLARRKADKVATRTTLPVLAADTLVVAADGGVLGKPASASEAAAMLRRLSGTTQRVVTGVCLRLPSGRTREAAVVTEVDMRRLSDAEIESYASSGEPFGKAGAYAIQETADRFVTAVRGSRTNVVGLPVDETLAMLREEAGP
ncbi:MAG: Maf-like protein YhdE [Planctomycetes bacterium]|nr:Maf-like protein YhdE [Planctomycetota bacterium]